MNSRRIKVNLGIIVVFALALVLLLFSKPIVRISTGFATVSGSYANTCIENHNLTQVELSDSQEQYFDLRYESFDYNIVSDSIKLTGYRGIGMSVVIPETIAGYTVSSIADSFWESASAIQELYVPNTLENAAWRDGLTITLYCYPDAEILDSDNMEEFTVQVLNDSDYVNFSLGDIPFSYNESDTEIEITSYNGDETWLIIPSYVNGKPVTTVSCPGLYLYEIVVFPETVTNIQSDLSLTFYSRVFLMEVAFLLLSTVAALIVLNILLPKKKEDYAWNGPQLLLSIVYIAFQSIFGVVFVYRLDMKLLTAGIIQAVVLAAYFLLMLMGSTGKQHAAAVEHDIKVKTSRMKELKIACTDLSDSVTDPNLKKRVSRFAEDLRYSDPVSGADLEEAENMLETCIDHLREAISDGDNDSIVTACERAEKALQKRNKLCEANKR